MRELFAPFNLCIRKRAPICIEVLVFVRGIADLRCQRGRAVNDRGAGGRSVEHMRVGIVQAEHWLVHHSGVELDRLVRAGHIETRARVEQIIIGHHREVADLPTGRREADLLRPVAPGIARCRHHLAARAVDRRHRRYLDHCHLIMTLRGHGRRRHHYANARQHDETEPCSFHDTFLLALPPESLVAPAK